MIAAEPRVELADVGALACLYRGDTGALSFLTPAARAAWLRSRDSNLGEDAALREAWRAQGFLDGRATAEVVEAAPVSPAKAPLLDRRYALGADRTCRLTVDVELLATLLAAVLRPLESDNYAPVTTSVAVTTAGDVTAVQVDGRIVFQGDMAAGRSETLRQLLLALVGWDEVGALLHASTVAGPRGAVALAGQSGSGKSTIAAELVADGLAYVADDLSALDRTGNAIYPFPLGVSVKSGSMDVVARRFPQLRNEPELTTRRLRVRYLDLGARAALVGRPLPLAALVFPVFDAAQAAIEAERLSPEAALHLAIESGSQPDGWPRSVQPLARLCNEVPAWHLVFGDAAAASGWVRAHLSDTP